MTAIVVILPVADAAPRLYWAFLILPGLPAHCVVTNTQFAGPAIGGTAIAMTDKAQRTNPLIGFAGTGRTIKESHYL